jgi:peroxiredoxin
MLLVSIGMVILGLVAGLGAWLLFELTRLSGRMLLRLDAVDQRLANLGERPAPIPVAPPVPQTPPVPLPPSNQRPQLALGSIAPGFTLPDLAGTQHSLADFKGRSLLIIFFNPGCGFCSRMAEALAKLAPDGGDGLPMPLVISAGSANDNRAMVEKFGLRCLLLLQSETQIANQYQATGTPMGYLVNSEGNIASPLTTGADALLALASGQAPTAAPPTPPPDLPLGSAAPAFELPDLAGSQRSLVEFKGRRVLLIFFSPHCGFCTRMADDLAKVPVEDGGDRVLPLLLSTGTVNDNRSMVEEYALRCPLVLQRQMEVAALYRCPGTPMGYLIDAQGNIASSKTSGADALLALCRPAPAAPAAANGSPAPGKAPANSSNGSHKPCARCKDGKTPCSCADKIAAKNGRATPAPVKDQAYDFVDLTVHASPDAMSEELLSRSDKSLRLIIVHGATGADSTSGLEAAALRRFLRQRPEWLVSYQPADARRFLVLSRDSRDRKALPSFLTKAANFANALAKHIGDGASKVTAEQMERRLEACTLCDRRTGDHCSACGCDLPTKAGWRTTQCPLGKWPALDKTRDANVPRDDRPMDMPMVGDKQSVLAG